MTEDMVRLKRIRLAGDKSIKEMDLELRSMNVLIGANGAGKSNLASFFAFLRVMRRGRLQRHVEASGADSLLFYGAKTTQHIAATLDYDCGHHTVGYRLRLAASPRDVALTVDESTLLVDEEVVEFPVVAEGVAMTCENYHVAAGAELTVQEVELPAKAACPADRMIANALMGYRVFHFGDTSDMAPIRRRLYEGDNQALRSDGGNLAVVLRRLRQSNPTAYSRIRETIRQIAPWFGDFVLEPIEPQKTDVRLDWHDRYRDNIFGPHQLPDGALRAIALITLLLQPVEDLPSLIVIDEPELGLHPAAITVLASLMKAASLYSQVIIATQSPTLLDEFDAADVVVVDRKNGGSTFTRLDPDRLKDWLEEYTLGELWQKNSIGGGPF